MIQYYKRQIEECQKAIKEIQEGCSHPKGALKIQYGESSGNYDPTRDCSWKAYYCTLCESSWIEDIK